MVFAELKRISALRCRYRADFFILHGKLTGDQNLLENIEVMARPKRFELLTRKFVVIQTGNSPLLHVKSSRCPHGSNEQGASAPTPRVGLPCSPKLATHGHQYGFLDLLLDRKLSSTASLSSRPGLRYIRCMAAEC